MRPVVVFGEKLVQELTQFLFGLPRFVCQPFFQGANETFSNAIRLRAMSGDQDVNEVFILGQLPENLSGEMGPSIRDEELEFWW